MKATAAPAADRAFFGGSDPGGAMHEQWQANDDGPEFIYCGQFRALPSKPG